MIDTLIQRINELETQLAHYERMTEDLSIVITKQGTDAAVLSINDPPVYLPAVLAITLSLFPP